jgi:hypothetical protein
MIYTHLKRKNTIFLLIKFRSFKPPKKEKKPPRGDFIGGLFKWFFVLSFIANPALHFYQKFRNTIELKVKFFKLTFYNYKKCMMTHHSVERRQQLQNFEVVAAHAPAAAATAVVVAAAADAAAAVAAVGQHEC